MERPDSQPSVTDAPPELSGVMRALAEAPAAMPNLPAGTVVGGDFRVEGVLGRGGMGTVYLARDLQLGRPVALKIQHDLRARTRERVLREAQALARLSHPNVVTVYAVGTHGRAVFIAMEYVDGADAGHWLEQEARTPAQILALYHQAGLGLAAAHDAGLVHRDFKPRNVLIGRDGSVKVADFGLARVEGPGTELGGDGGGGDGGEEGAPETLTRTGAVLGTPAYMAPEQRFGLAADARSDQFSYATAVAEALYGDRPEANARLGRRRGVPRVARVALARALRADPAERFPGMGELLRALDPARRRRVRALTGVTTMVVGVAAVGGVMFARPDPCAAPSRRALDLFGAADTRRLGRPGTVESLRTWALDWGRARREVCLAATHETRPADDLAARQACLELAAHAFATTLRLGAESDALDPARLQAAVEGLPVPAECLRDGGALLGPPTEQREDVRAFLSRLADLRVEGFLRGAPSAERQQALLDEARKLGFEPALAKTLARLGRWALDVAQWKLAHERLEEAFMLAHGVGDDLTATEAAADEAWALAESAADLDRAELWVRLAEAAARRSTDGPRTRHKIGSARARLLEARGEYGEAVKLYRELVREMERRSTRSPLNETNMLVNLGAALDAAGEPEQALESYERALRETEELLGPESIYGADIQSNLGLTLTALGRYDEAVDHLRRAIASYERAKVAPKVVDARLNLGIALGAAGRLDEALTELQAVRAIQIETLGPSHDDVGLTEGALGWLHGQAGRHGQAAEALARAREIHLLNLGPDHPEVLKVSEQYAAALHAAGRGAEACAVYRDLAPRAAKGADSSLAGAVQEALAACPP